MPFRRKPCPECDLVWEFIFILVVFFGILAVL